MDVLNQEGRRSAKKQHCLSKHLRGVEPSRIPLEKPIVGYYLSYIFEISFPSHSSLFSVCWINQFHIFLTHFVMRRRNWQEEATFLRTAVSAS